MKKYYVLVDIGCIECGEESHVIGIFTDINKAQKSEKDHEMRQEKKWTGQHLFEIFEIEKIDKVYRVKYRK